MHLGKTVNKQVLACNSAAPQWSLPALEKMQHGVHQCFIFRRHFHMESINISRGSVCKRLRMWWVDEQTGSCVTGVWEAYDSRETQSENVKVYLWCVCHSGISSTFTWDGEFHFRCQKQKSDSESFWGETERWTTENVKIISATWPKPWLFFSPVS